jgi:predicted regulator of Ras-like GTPase activity (Roadblock/LC7/MglB family)
MSTPFAPMLENLTRQRGVRASLIVSESDGLVVDSNVRFGQDGDRVAALAASLYRKARLSASAARLGDVPSCKWMPSGVESAPWVGGATSCSS